jgi:hypothetical protein
MSDYMQNESNSIAATAVKKSSKRKILRHYLPLILVVLVIVLGLTSAYFYKKSKSANTTDQASQAEVKSLIEKVSRLLVVPTDETPTVATVSDPDALKGQAFFADAKKGDKVLIYSNAKKAVLYDPVLDKIVTVAPLNIDATAKAPAAAPTTDTTKPASTTPTKKK